MDVTNAFFGKLNTPKTGEDLADDDNNEDKNNATPAAARHITYNSSAARG